jgi:hypothetical protein
MHLTPTLPLRRILQSKQRAEQHQEGQGKGQEYGNISGNEHGETIGTFTNPLCQNNVQQLHQKEQEQAKREKQRLQNQQKQKQQQEQEDAIKLSKMREGQVQCAGIEEEVEEGWHGWDEGWEQDTEGNWLKWVQDWEGTWFKTDPPEKGEEKMAADLAAERDLEEVGIRMTHQTTKVWV